MVMPRKERKVLLKLLELLVLVLRILFFLP